MELSIVESPAQWKRLVASAAWSAASAAVAWNAAGALAAILVALGVAGIGYRWWIPAVSTFVGAPPRPKRLAVVAGTIVGTWLLLRALPLVAPAEIPRGLPRLAFHAVHLGALWTLLVGAGVTIVRWEPAPYPLRRGEAWLLALLPMLTWTVWLLAFFPGMMSSDSIDQWLQAATGKMIDAHPVTHTVLIRGLQALWASPAVVGSAQILASGLLWMWAARLLGTAGAPRWALWTSAVLLAFSPVYGPLVITLWKDVPFSLGVVALVLMLFRLARAPGQDIGWGFWSALCVIGAATILFRHNGIPAVIGAVAAALLLRPRWWKRALLAGVVTVLLANGTRTAIVALFDAAPYSQSFGFVGFLGAHVAHGTPLSAEEREILDDIHPLDSRWSYDCFSQGPTLFGGKFDRPAIERYKRELPLMTLRLTARNPGATAAHLGCASSMIWRVLQGSAPLYGPHLWRRPDGELHHIDPNALGIAPAPVLPTLRQRLADWIGWTTNPHHSWLFWRPAVPLYLLALAALLVCLRARSWRPALLLAPVALHTAALIVFIPAQDARYQLPVFLAALILLPAWLLLPRTAHLSAEA